MNQFYGPGPEIFTVALPFLSPVVSTTETLNNYTAAGDAMALDMIRAVPVTNTPETIGDALNAARAQDIGRLVLKGTNPTLLAPD